MRKVSANGEVQTLFPSENIFRKKDSPQVIKGAASPKKSAVSRVSAAAIGTTIGPTSAYPTATTPLTRTPIATTIMVVG